MVAANQATQGEQGVPAQTPEDEMKRMRDIVGSALAFQLKPLLEKVAALEARLPEQHQQATGYPMPATAYGGQPGAMPQGYRYNPEDIAFMARAMQECGYNVTPANQRQDAQEEAPDYSDAVDDIMDTLRDAHPDMTRQEARGIAYDVIDEAEKTKRDPADVFAARWESENEPGVERKVFQPAIIGRLNRVAARYGHQLTPLQQAEQAQEPAQEQQAVAHAKTPPAIAERGAQSMPIASQSPPVNPSRAKGKSDRDKAVADGVDGFLNEIDGKAVPD